MIPELRDFQLSMTMDISLAALHGAKRIVVQAATGAGKTTIAAQMVKRCADKGNRCLFLAHRRRLVDQISNRLRQFEIDHAVLMRGERYDQFAQINVASRDTLTSRCFRNEWLPLPPADLVIVDEARHAAAPESDYRKILAQYPNAVVLLLDATPVGPDGAGLGPWAQAMVCSPPTSQLVDQGYLVPVRCYAPDRKRRRNGAVKRGIAGDLVSSWQEYAEGRPTVLFLSRVQHSVDAVNAFMAAGIPAVHMDADTPDDVRDRAFEDVARGEIKVVSNVGIIGEGVDVPELEVCQLYCEVSSRTRFLQACGRIMRAAPGKTHGILIDHSGACFRHGFPDEDTEWTLAGNVDEKFEAKHKAGETEKAYYCGRCELAYHGQENCPQCGRAPVKPPRSIFAPPVEHTNEMLVEAERGQQRDTQEERVQHWLRCLAVAANRGWTFAQARVIYRRKYDEWPGDDFPAQWTRWMDRVEDVYPNFRRVNR